MLNDELGLESNSALPETVILLARPDEHELESMSANALREYYRRLHFHARVHVALDRRRAQGALTELIVAERLEEIGSSVFDEIRSVLEQEAFLLPPVSTVSVYIEFAAVFLELRYSAPDVVAAYFPSIDDFDRIERLLTRDVDLDSVLAFTGALVRTRPLETGELHRGPRKMRNRSIAAAPSDERRFGRHSRVAAQAARRGNDVRAGIVHTRASWTENAERAARAGRSRLRTCSGSPKGCTKLWASRSTRRRFGRSCWRSFCAVCARVLESRGSDALRPAKSLSRLRTRQLRRRLALLAAVIRQAASEAAAARRREALMSKHLKTAEARIAKVLISEGEREQLGRLLHEANNCAEMRLRDRLRPVLQETLIEVGFLPQNVPERVSFRKIVEELLDHVVETGYFSMGEIRDAIARNNLKLDDVADPLELVAGDRLLRADRRLASRLEGVYQRGAIYLRLLQGLSSCAFGTNTGRFLTLAAVIPFGGAFVVLSFFDHMHEEIHRLRIWWSGGNSSHAEPLGLTHPLFTIPLGLVIFGLIHSPQFRGMVWRLLRAMGRGLRTLVVDIPAWLMEVTFVKRLLASVPVVFFRRRLLMSTILTGVFCGLIPAVHWYRHPTPAMTGLVFLGLAALLNSRIGRDIEELSAERLQLIWHRVRVRVFVALFDLVMDFFKSVLEWLERILYEIQEWFYFKSNETRAMLWTKAVLGVPWAVARFFIAFFVTVLIEPQINPIKHFPVVTVSHKVLLPMQPLLAQQLVPIFGAVLANTVAGMTVLMMPGVVGFLVWELRGNWRLYAVNRRRDLRPVVVGSHGETMVRLMKFGIHSGTLPRLYRKVRRAARRSDPSRRVRQLMGSYAKLHHVELSVRHFFEREFLGFLAESSAFAGIALEVGETDVGTNSLRAEIRAPQLGDESLWIAFEEQSGYVMAHVSKAGWLERLNPAQLATLRGLLIGIYRVGGTDLVDEQILACLGSQARPFDVTEEGLVLLPRAVAWDPRFTIWKRRPASSRECRTGRRSMPTRPMPPRSTPKRSCSAAR